MKVSYDELCLYREFNAGLVELPRLFHEVAKRVTGLSVGRFHEELEALKDERTVELKVLNEVAQAKEPELAIHRNDRLYYFVIWR